MKLFQKTYLVYCVSMFSIILPLATSAYTIPTDITNAKQYVQELVVTDNGLPSGGVIMHINSGGNIALQQDLAITRICESGFSGCKTLNDFVDQSEISNFVSDTDYDFANLVTGGQLSAFIGLDALDNYVMTGVLSGYRKKTDFDPNAYISSINLEDLQDQINSTYNDRSFEAADLWQETEDINNRADDNQGYTENQILDLSSKLDEDITYMQVGLDNLQLDVADDLDDMFNQLTSDIDNLRNDLEPQIQENTSRLDDTESNLQYAISRLDDLESQLSDLDSRISDNEGRMDDIESRLDDIESRLDAGGL